MQDNRSEKQSEKKTTGNWSYEVMRNSAPSQSRAASEKVPKLSLERLQLLLLETLRIYIELDLRVLIERILVRAVAITEHQLVLFHLI
ncbi:hypothetical protein Tco_1076671 [Tanacetum coccineum]